MSRRNTRHSLPYPLVPEDLFNELRPKSICSGPRIRVISGDSLPMSAGAFFIVSRA